MAVEVFEPFEDFIPVAPVEPATIAKYEGVLDESTIAMWQTHGYGMAANGFIKVIDPDRYLEMIGDYLPLPDMIPVLATGTGDIIVAVRGTHRVLQYRYHAMRVFTTTLRWLGGFVADEESLNEFLDYAPYAEAAEVYGPLTAPEDFDYIYAYKLPLPVGGPSGVENLARVRIFENISIITQWVGMIPFSMEGLGPDPAGGGA